jgi:hypothetical protein
LPALNLSVVISLASACSLGLAQTAPGLFGTSSLVTRVIMQHDVANFNVPNSVIVIAIKQKANIIVIDAIFYNGA